MQKITLKLSDWCFDAVSGNAMFLTFGAVTFLILNLEAPVWHLEGPIWHLEAPIWLFEGPIWLCILPEPGQKSAAVSFFSTEGGGQLECSLEHNGGDSLLL